MGVILLLVLLKENELVSFLVLWGVSWVNPFAFGRPFERLARWLESCAVQALQCLEVALLP